MPSVSKKQQRFMGADLARAKAGKPTKTNMSVKQLSEFAGGPIAKKAPPHFAAANKRRKNDARSAKIGAGLLKL